MRNTVKPFTLTRDEERTVARELCAGVPGARPSHPQLSINIQNAQFIASRSSTFARLVAEHESRATALLAAITKACGIIETGDERLLADDGPVGARPPDLSLAEWRQLYVILDDARKAAK